jgi:hypothetical protein
MLCRSARPGIVCTVLKGVILVLRGEQGLLRALLEVRSVTALGPTVREPALYGPADPIIAACFRSEQDELHKSAFLGVNDWDKPH